ncbi:MAG: 3-dehydroquinate synthase [Candidatus Omnitrophica bacterium]|nr:3-dehydroquinate synthase [Candidatus Omnitrophota bacterium]
MKTIRVNLGKRSYDIIVGYRIIKSLSNFLTSLNIGKDAYIITNPLIKKIYGKLLEQSLVRGGFSVRFKPIPDTEKSKSIETATSVLKNIAAYNRQKRVFIIAFGGGVIGDLAGFVASVYKRGVPYIQIPTTLLAQVDSSIGGKTAVDLIEAKNVIGAIYQPRLVLSEIEFLKTLDIRQIRNGLAEVIKYSLIKDKKMFEYLERNYKYILRKRPSSLEYIILRSSAIKAKIVEQDEREEKGIRTFLNFGHTVGHAIEAADFITTERQLH